MGNNKRKGTKIFTNYRIDRWYNIPSLTQGSSSIVLLYICPDSRCPVLDFYNLTAFTIHRLIFLINNRLYIIVPYNINNYIL